MPNRIDQEGRITLSEKERKVLKGRIRAAKTWAESCRRLRDADRDVGFRKSSEKSFGGSFDESDRNLSLVAGTYWADRNVSGIKSRNHVLGALAVKYCIMSGGKTQFIATARRSRFMAQAETAAKLLNHQWDALSFDRETDQACWDSLIHKRGGVVELGWRYDDGNTRREGGKPTPSEIEEANAEAGQDSLPEAEPLIDDPFVERFDPRDFLVDPACTSYTLKDARSVFRRKREYLAKLKRNPRYKNTADLKGDFNLYWGRHAEDDRTPPEDEQEDRAEVTIYDGYVLYDLDNDGEEECLHVIFAEEQDEELLCELGPYPWFRGNNPFPFEIMPAFISDNDSLDGVADATTVRDTQVAHDESLTQVEYQRGHSPRVFVVPPGLFSGEEGKKNKKRIESGTENLAFESDTGLSGFGWCPPPPIYVDAYKVVETAPEDIRRLIGVTEFEANILPEKQMTLGEANQLASQGANRRDVEVEKYHDFLCRIAYKILVLDQQFIGRDREFLYLDREQQHQWGQANPETLRRIVPGTQTPTDPLGELEQPGIQFVLEVDAAKKLPKNEYTERQQAMELVAKLTPFAQMPDPRLPTRPMVNMPALIRGIVQSYNLPNAEDIVPPDPTPEELSELSARQEEQQKMALAQMLAGGGSRPGGDGSGPPGESTELQGAPAGLGR